MPDSAPPSSLSLSLGSPWLDAAALGGTLMALNGMLAPQDPGWLSMNPSPWLLLPMLTGLAHGFRWGFFFGSAASLGFLGFFQALRPESLPAAGLLYFLSLPAAGLLAGGAGRSSAGASTRENLLTDPSLELERKTEAFPPPGAAMAEPLPSAAELALEPEPEPVSASASPVVPWEEMENLLVLQKELEARLAAREGEIARLLAEGETLTEDWRDRGGKLEVLISGHAALSAKLEESAECWKTQLAAREAEIAELSAQRDELRAGLNGRGGELAELAGSQEELRAKLAAREVEIAELSAQRERLEENLAARGHEWSALVEERDRLSSERDTLSALLADSEQRSETCAAEAREKERRLSAEHAEVLESLRSGGGELGAKIAELGETVRALETERREILDHLTERERGLAELEGRLEQREREFAELGARLADRDTVLESRSAQLETLTADLAGREEELTASRADLAGRGEELDVLRSDLAGREEELDVLRADLAGRGEELAALRADLAGREEELAALRADLAGRGEELAALRADLAGREEELDVLRADLAGRGEELDVLRADLAGRGEELDVLRVDSARAQENLAELRAQIPTLTEALARAEEKAEDAAALAEPKAQSEVLAQPETSAKPETISGPGTAAAAAAAAAGASEFPALAAERVLELEAELRERESQQERISGERDEVAARLEEREEALRRAENMRDSLTAERDLLEARLKDREEALRRAEDMRDSLTVRLSEQNLLLESMASRPAPAPAPRRRISRSGVLQIHTSPRLAPGASARKNPRAGGGEGAGPNKAAGGAAESGENHGSDAELENFADDVEGDGEAFQPAEPGELKEMLLPLDADSAPLAERIRALFAPGAGPVFPNLLQLLEDLAGVTDAAVYQIDGKRLERSALQGAEGKLPETLPLEGAEIAHLAVARQSFVTCRQVWATVPTQSSQWLAALPWPTTEFHSPALLLIHRMHFGAVNWRTFSLIQMVCRWVALFMELHDISPATGEARESGASEEGLSSGERGAVLVSPELLHRAVVDAAAAHREHSLPSSILRLKIQPDLADAAAVLPALLLPRLRPTDLAVWHPAAGGRNPSESGAPEPEKKAARLEFLLSFSDTREAETLAARLRESLQSDPALEAAVSIESPWTAGAPGRS